MDKSLTGLLIFLVIWSTWGFFWITHENNEKDLACERLGFESYEYVANTRFCEDIEGNLHYVKMECKPWYWISCTAKPISVGGVRVR